MKRVPSPRSWTWRSAGWETPQGRRNPRRPQARRRTAWPPRTPCSPQRRSRPGPRNPRRRSAPRRRLPHIGPDGGCSIGSSAPRPGDAGELAAPVLAVLRRGLRGPDIRLAHIGRLGHGRGPRRRPGCCRRCCSGARPPSLRGGCGCRGRFGRYAFPAASASHAAWYAIRSGVVTCSSPARRRSRGTPVRTGAGRHRPSCAAPAPARARRRSPSCTRDRSTTPALLSLPLPPLELVLRSSSARCARSGGASKMPMLASRTAPDLPPVITSSRPSGLSTSIAARRRAAASRSRNGSAAAPPGIPRLHGRSAAP